MPFSFKSLQNLPERVISNILEFFRSISVARAICISFGFAICLGSFPIYLSELGNVSLVDSFYLSASAFCVTGLTPIPISTLNLSTKFIMMMYIQMGGLGIIVFTVLIGLMVVSGLSRNTQLQEFIKEVLDADLGKYKETPGRVSESGKVWRMIISIFNITISIEIIGAVALYLTFPEDLPDIHSRIFISIFTSISAFNNAGFSLFDDLNFIKLNPLPIYVVVSLIVLGGIGYPVIIFIEKSILRILREVFSHLEILGETHLMRQAIKGQEPSNLYFLFTKLSVWTEYRIEAYNETLYGESNRVQTSLIFYGTLILLLGGTFLFLAMEFHNESTIGALSFHDKFANSLLLSASSRTAGFNTFAMSNVYAPSLALLCVLMFIGGGPQGTAGGIKITTFAILVKYLGNVINSTSKVEIFGHTISKRSVAMSIRLYFLGTSVIAIIIFILAILHAHNNKLQDITFEVISAFSTVGLSLGLTPKLSGIEKIIYSIIMYVGRIGIFTILISLTGNPVTSQIGGEDLDVKIQVG